MFGIAAIIAGLAKAAGAAGTAATTAAPAAATAGAAINPLVALATSTGGGIGAGLGTVATAGGVGAPISASGGGLLGALAEVAAPAEGLQPLSVVGDVGSEFDLLKALQLGNNIGSGARTIHAMGERPATPNRQTGIVNAGNIRTRNESPTSGPSANYFAQSGRGFKALGNASTWKALTTGDKPDPMDPVVDATKRDLRADRFVPGASSEMDRLLGVRTGNYVSEGVLKMLTSRGILDSSKGGNPMITNPYLRR